MGSFGVWLTANLLETGPFRIPETGRLRTSIRLQAVVVAAERDLLQMQVQAGELFARLVGQHGFQPALHWWRHHNHVSPGASIGTADTPVSGPLGDFLRRAVAR